MTLPYLAPRWLPGGHLQTLWPLLRTPARPPYRRTRWDTPDGDFVDVDWIPGPDDAPLVVLFHGLEGSSDSHYARALMQALLRRGWRGAVAHFRGCAGEPNRLARAYHSGDSAEIDWMLKRFRGGNSDAPLFAAGVSLGANALLKWLGEQGEAAAAQLQGAAAICPPLDLHVSGRALGQGFNRIYTQNFLGTLKAKALAKAERFPGCFDVARIRAARDLYAFDDAYTAPAHGFADADDYWTRASSRPWLPSVAVPTLLITSASDSFVPAAALPQRLSPQVRHEHLAAGGHVGFVSGPFPGHIEWPPQRVLAHFTDLLTRT